MKFQDIRYGINKLEDANRYLLCIYDDAFEKKDFVQVVLKSISDEPDFIEKNEIYFDTNSQDNFYYVKADSFSKYIAEDAYVSDFSYLPFNRQIDELENYLNGKIIVVDPYYFCNEDRQVFYKNGQVVDVIDECSLGEFFCIPKIPNDKAYQSFLKNKEFPLPDVSESLLGIPRYLGYDEEIFSIENLQSSKENDSYWKVENINNIEKCKLNYEDGTDKGFIIDCDERNFLFVNKDFLLSSAKTSLAEHCETTKDVEIEEESKYEDSEVGKTLQKFYNFTKSHNLCYSKDDIYNFYTCACSSQLIILAGMSGTGKTKLALEFADFFNMKESNDKLLFVPISPSFTEPSDVLGYLNPNTGIYTSSETRLVEFLKHAEEHEDEMHMVVFDEMNLAQIEFWFAPFISLLEKELGDRKLHLYSESQRCINDDKYPCKIELKNNIIFVGTINLDETTKNISDRLLDRAFIINLKKESFANYKAQQASNSTSEKEPFQGDFKKFVPEKGDLEKDYISDYSLEELQFFDAVNDELNNIDSQKGVSFRSVKNIALYLRYKPEELDKNKAFDYAFKQTVMKKINGTVESIGDFIGYDLNQDGESNGKLTQIFDKFHGVSDFKECRLEIKNKVQELKKYGYAR